MYPHKNPSPKFIVPFIAVLGFFVPTSVTAFPDDATLIHALKTQAASLEEQREWAEASRLYRDILERNRNLPDIRRRYIHCLRRSWQQQRFKDDSYRKEVLSLEYGQAYRLYQLVFGTLADRSLDKGKIKAVQLFRKGLRELSWALKDPEFVETFCPEASLDDVQAFRESLVKVWGALPITSRNQAMKGMEDVALAAADLLHLDATVVVLEFACGACYALDEYTAYLSPTQIRELWVALRNSTYVGVGITPIVEDGKLTVGQILPFTSAHDAKIQGKIHEDDFILEINNKSALGLSPAAALHLLEGEPGTTVKLVIAASTMSPTNTLVLKRQAGSSPSVSSHMLTQDVGYLRISLFNESTVQDLDDVVGSLSRMGVKGVILDLRGNPGGLFESAIESARRFLRSGVIASTKDLNSKHKTVFRSKNAHAFKVPMVVLVDGNTASAAEVLAGALKENNRAQLVGQSTYGKSCIQTLFKLPTSPGGFPTGGLRITVARYYSPNGKPYTGNGIQPDHFVERFSMSHGDTGDQQLQQAQLIMSQMIMVCE